ncbi:MAG: hypothetical protein K0R24_1664 [Gammaproteobacteria bacterium]|jgi:hypothetical protein|nr:hypothetical protein [Gammaproteobacteria bacterium]MCE3238683.1 hypothetical protein [Gammaproteobacteria bacterium]
MKAKYKCPCCGYYTLESEPPGSYSLCPVCFWEDDGVQFEDADYCGGSNRVSLNKARKNFLKYGACDEEAVPYVRSPLPCEIPQ